MTDHVALYRLLAAIGFDRPVFNEEGIPSIAWAETRVGIALAGDVVPEGWDVLPLNANLLALAEFGEELRGLRTYQLDPSLRPSPSTRNFVTVSTPVPNPLSFHALYRLLAGLGFEEPVLNADGAPAISWPQTRTGVLASGDRVQGEWVTVRIGPEFNTLGDLALLLTRYQLRLSGSSATRRISSDEQRLLDEILQAGLPTPDRNFKVVDDEGKFRGVVDFVWDEMEGVDVRVAVELDGWYWHAGGDLKELLARLADEKEVAQVVHKETRSRVTRDAAKRRVLSRRGWIVLQVTDDEVRRPDGAKRVAEEVRATVTRRFLEAKQREAAGSPVTMAERLD